MSKAKNRKAKDGEQCFYCGATVGDLQQDHFPIPERNGGTETVPCCIVCHQMKDTVTFENWPVEWLPVLMRDMELVSRETRLFFAKSLAIISDAQRIVDTGKVTK